MNVQIYIHIYTYIHIHIYMYICTVPLISNFTLMITQLNVAPHGTLVKTNKSSNPCITLLENVTYNCL